MHASNLIGICNDDVEVTASGGRRLIGNGQRARGGKICPALIDQSGNASGIASLSETIANLSLEDWIRRNGVADLGGRKSHAVEANRVIVAAESFVCLGEMISAL